MRTAVFTSTDKVRLDELSTGDWGVDPAGEELFIYLGRKEKGLLVFYPRLSSQAVIDDCPYVTHLKEIHINAR